MSKFCTLVGSTNPASTSPRVIRTFHDRFHLLACLLSNELAELADRSDGVDWAAVDSGAVVDNSIYWKLFFFQNGFPLSPVDGNLWADKSHFEHPFIKNYDDKVSPKTHGMHSSTELQLMWKELQKEYDKLFTNFNNPATTAAVSQDCEDIPHVHKNSSKQQMDNAQPYATANLPLSLTTIHTCNMLNIIIKCYRLISSYLKIDYTAKFKHAHP